MDTPNPVTNSMNGTHTPRWAYLVMVLFWISTIFTDAAAMRLDPQSAAVPLEWSHFLAKRGLLAFFWMAVSAGALRWYAKRPIAGDNLVRSLLLAATAAAAICLAYGIHLGGVLSLMKADRSWREGIALIWGVDLLYAYFTVWQIVVAVNAFYYYRNMMQRRRESEQLQLKLAKIELMLFRAQLEPHFLCNALNSIASLVRLRRHEAAVDALNELGALLRSVLEVGERQLMPWHWESEFSRLYVKLQKLRFAERLQVHFDVDDVPAHTPIPILLLQPLIENAIHHGPLVDGATCDVSIRLRTTTDRVELQVSNTAAQHAARHNHGLGLNNIAARLKGLYGDNFLFRHGRDGERFVVRAEFPLLDADAVHA